MQYKLIRSKRKTLSLEIDRNGEIIVRSPYWVSVRKIECFLKDKEAWILKHMEFQKYRTIFPTDQKSLFALRKQAENDLLPRIREMSARFDLPFQSVRITSAKSRFGSCSKENRICLSLFLMLYPVEAREYVILHELCHTVEHNHSKRFYDLLDRYMPDHRERRKLLR